MRNSDDLSIIVKWCAQIEHNHSSLVQWFSSVAQIIFQKFFVCLSDGYQTTYLLIELQVKGESQKLLLSDTLVAAQTFSVDELPVSRLALQWWEVTLKPSVCVVRPCRKVVSTEDMQTSTASALATLQHHREYQFISCLVMPIIGSSTG